MGIPVFSLSLAARSREGNRLPFSIRQSVGLLVPVSSASAERDSGGLCVSRYFLSGCSIVERGYHIGNNSSIRDGSKVSTAGNDKTMGGFIVSAMVTRIGPKRPKKLYIAEWRELRGLTQEQLADRIDATKATISRYETGARVVGGKVLPALAHALNLEVPDLYRHPDRPSADELLRHAPVEVQERAIDVIRAMLGKNTPRAS